jgi:outer membrane protein OmpA-like peptidoglycan-associated protein
MRQPGTPATPQAKPGERPKSTFDVVRIDPQGASVFAGQAPPNSEVTILADGRPVASARADASGAWAAVTEREFAPAEYEFSLRAKSGGDVTAGQRVRLAVAPPPPRPAATLPPTQFIARAEALPGPVTFAYNEATLTDSGRKAMAGLAGYLKAKQPASVTLTGHADERGSDSYNMELSRQRLDVVATYLREQGFTGKLELVPKGRSEPYSVVDRRSLPRDEVYQLDRRVELRAAR